MNPMIFSVLNQHPTIEHIANQQGYDIGEVILHTFPDGETYIRLPGNLKDREIILLESLDGPNPKILPLLFFAETARTLGARRVGLCAPYLAYMRQDKQFKPDEGITSAYFAKFLSQSFDWLVTVEPHLHRYSCLSDIYSVSNEALEATSAIALWIDAHVKNPVLIGPDSESEQWVARIAQIIDAPYFIFKKNRFGDEEVEVLKPEVELFPNHTPVLVDDIISTAQTMIEAIKQLKKTHTKAPVCVGVHAVFAEHAYSRLLQAGAEIVVTCNTIPHESSAIDLSGVLGEGIQRQLHRTG